MNKLHVLFLCGWYPSRVFKTNGDFIKRHALAVATKHQISVIHIVTDILQEETIKLERSGNSNFVEYIAYVKASNSIFSKHSIFKKAFYKVFNQLKDVDIVHLNEAYPFGILAQNLKKKKGIPYIISEHWTGYLNENRRSIGLMRKVLERGIFKNASFISPVSENLSNAIQSLKYNGKFQVVPNVVNTDIFKPKKKPKSKTLEIIHISDLNDNHKNISGMLRVIKRLKEGNFNFFWRFIGGEKEEYQDTIQEFNIDNLVEFKNHIPQKKLASSLQNSDVSVLFSNYENLPCVVLESFSSGIPVISTNVGGISEYFPKDFGKLITKGSEDELYDALYNFHNEAFATPDKMHEFAEENFSKDKISSEFSKLYSKALS